MAAGSCRNWSANSLKGHPGRTVRPIAALGRQVAVGFGVHGYSPSDRSMSRNGAEGCDRHHVSGDPNSDDAEHNFRCRVFTEPYSAARRRNAACGQRSCHPANQLHRQDDRYDRLAWSVARRSVRHSRRRPPRQRCRTSQGADARFLNTAVISSSSCSVRLRWRGPRPWACSARRLGRLGRRLSRASHHATTGLGFRLALVTVLPCSACAIELQDQHAGARTYRHSEARAKEAKMGGSQTIGPAMSPSDGSSIVAGYQTGCALPYAGNFQGICKKI
jgi:hypothetical protein